MSISLARVHICHDAILRANELRSRAWAKVRAPQAPQLLDKQELGSEPFTQLQYVNTQPAKRQNNPKAIRNLRQTDLLSWPDPCADPYGFCIFYIFSLVLIFL
ncbi:hypothetical protein AOLI_G00200660 [Acnodon oligacanthus]